MAGTGSAKSLASYRLSGACQELEAKAWADKEVRELIDALPRLIALKNVTINNQCLPPPPL